MQRPNPRQADHHDQTATRGWPRAPFGARPPRRRRQPRSQRAVKVISGKVSACREPQPLAPGLGGFPINRMAASSPGRVTGRSWQSPCNQRDFHPRRRHNRAATYVPSFPTGGRCLHATRGLRPCGSGILCMYLAQPEEGMRGRALVMAFAAFPHCVPLGHLSA